MFILLIKLEACKLSFTNSNLVKCEFFSFLITELTESVAVSLDNFSSGPAELLALINTGRSPALLFTQPSCLEEFVTVD
jgi:hypothetical protein